MSKQKQYGACSHECPFQVFAIRHRVLNSALTFFIIIVALLKAILFYLIIKILHDKKLELSQPFNQEVCLFISRISYLTFSIGLFCSWGVKYSEWIIEKGIQVPDIEHLRLGGADVWLFIGIVLFVIAQMFIYSDDADHRFR